MALANAPVDRNKTGRVKAKCGATMPGPTSMASSSTVGNSDVHSVSPGAQTFVATLVDICI